VCPFNARDKKKHRNSAKKPENKGRYGLFRGRFMIILNWVLKKVVDDDSKGISASRNT
jgi:hypothetical protein